VGGGVVGEAGCASVLIRFEAAAPPERVWSALTCPRLTSRFLYGIALHSDWTAGAELSGLTVDGRRVTGEVLFAAPPRQLSYTFDDACGAATYVCWRLRPNRTGSLVKLRVDEPWHGSSKDDLDHVWRPVTSLLGEILAGTTSG
jgi:uncharacterized protein YndB with AHSA1/START domain